MLRTTQMTDHSRSLTDLVPLSQLVHDSIMACDVDVRASLLQNIVVVGNTSLTKGLTERLDVELAGLLPSVSHHSSFFFKFHNMKKRRELMNSKRSKSIHLRYLSKGNTQVGWEVVYLLHLVLSINSGLRKMNMRNMECRSFIRVSGLCFIFCDGKSKSADF